MKRAYRTLPSHLFIIVLIASLAAPALMNSSWAQDDAAVEEFIPLGIPPLSNRTALLSFPLSVFPFNEPNAMPIIRLQELAEITVVLEDRTIDGIGLDVEEDFLPMTTSAINSGLSLYKESEAKRGFSYAVEDQSKDLPIDLLEKPIVVKDPVVPGRYTVTFRPITGSANVQLPFFKDQFADFYVVCRTSLNLRQGDRFEAYIPANGIRLRDLRQTLPKDTLYDDRFPGDSFADLNPDFTVPAIFEGDIINIVNLITDAEGKNRLDASSQPTTILGLDMVGRADEGYFLEEVRVNFLGINMAAIAKLIENLTQQGTGSAGFLASSPVGTMDQVIVYTNPTFFYSPWFYNTPFDMNTGLPLTTIAPIDGETEIPMTMPLDFYGAPRSTFQIGMDDPRAHYTSYVSYGPRQPGAFGLTPRVVTQDVFKALQANAEGGIFLFRELGGTHGQFDKGVDQLINLDNNGFRVESFEVSPDAAADQTSPLFNLMRHMLPGAVAGDSGKDVVPWLFGDDNLAMWLMGVMELPDPVDGLRAAYGSLECTEDPDCYFFDLMINILRPYLGLTEGQIRYLFEYTEGNGRTNSQDLFDYNLVQGFSFVLPVAKNNAISNLQAPSARTGENAGADIFIAVRTSDNLRNLDTLIPFVQPLDIKVGNRVKEFTQNVLDNVSSFQSVSSIGYGRANSSSTFSLIGRPRPRFIYSDLTQPGDNEQAGNNNILFDSSLSSPPKAVIGIDAQDFGQNPSLTNNHSSVQYDMFDTFFTESAVFGEVQIDFIPGTRSSVFNPLLLNAIPLEVGISVDFNRVISSHSVALYYDDDTPSGNGRDDDGDGLYDEEWFNLQDDDGDGLIDEDLGDNNPAGISGVFDAMDHYLPTDRDRFGGASGAYVYNPNDQAKYQDFITAIQPADNPLELVEGGSLPLSIGEGSFFTELDMRALQMDEYLYVRSMIYPPSGFTRGSSYNQGMMSTLEPRTGLLDLIPALRQYGSDFANFPFYPDDLFVETPDGEIIWMVQLTSETDTIGVIPDPDGDVRRTFALSANGQLRMVHPSRGFLRVGWTPMVVQVSEIDSAGVSDPQGDSMQNAPYNQFGIDLTVADARAIGDYISGIADSLGDAYDQARDQIADYYEGVADAEASAAEADPPEDPDYPDIPDPQEVTIASPNASLGINSFNETDNGRYTTNYQYLLQIPDENFGPLEGDDFYVVLRSSAQAAVGESFRVRIRSGQRNSRLITTDDNGATISVMRPQGGIGYYSFLETDFGLTATAFPNVSKNQITTSEIVVQSINVAPSLTFVSPTSGSNIADDDFLFDIAFVAQDPDNVAEIQLYVDTDSLNFDGDFIPGAILREGFDSTFQINLLEDVLDFDPTQEYYIYARLDDGVNQPVYVYSDGPIITTVAGAGTDEPGDSGHIVTGDLENPLDYVKLRDDGIVYSFGDAPSFLRINSTTRIIDMEPSPTFSGIVAVQVNGKPLGGGDIGTTFARNLMPDGSFSFPEGSVYFFKNALSGGELIANPTEGQIEIENACDVEVDFKNGAIYVLDGDGDMLFLGKADTNLRPAAVGIDLYRDMELGPNGKQMYFLTGNGMMSVAGSASLSGWSNIVPGDVYRDMSLRVRSGVVTHVVLTDENGTISVVGPDGAVKTAILSLTPEEAITPGSVRQVKLFADTDKTIMLVEGGGKVHYLTSEEKLIVPSDRLIFSDDPGMEDDRIVDAETTSVDLQSVVTSVRDIIDGFANENVSRIMAYVSPDYKDRAGMDAAGLQIALNSFFEFFEIQNYAESRAIQDSFTLTNQGDTITAQVIVDTSLWYPALFYDIPDVDSSSTAGETTGQMLFTQNVITFDQSITVREVADGRGWMVDLYEIRNFGRQMTDLITSEDVEFDDITYLLSLPNNRRLGTYVPRSVGPDPTILLNLDINEDNVLEPYNVLAVFREPYLTRNTQPPAFEFSMYTGSFISYAGFDTVTYTFKRDSKGVAKLTSMNLRQLMSSNDSQFLSVDITGGQQQNPLSSLDGQEVSTPFGFSFMKRGPVRAVFQGDADLTFPDNQTILASFPLGGIMMLPENMDIFSLNPKVLVGNSITRTVVKVNPFDPNAGTGQETPGYTASLVAGRSYFVIAGDGKHYGFLQIPEDAAAILNDANQAEPIIPFDFRFEESFILPPNF